MDTTSSTPSLLMRAERSVLVVIDLQEKLAPAIPGIEAILTRAEKLIRAARRLDVPVLATEQYPKGLGPTAASLRPLLDDGEVIEKIHFSAAAEAPFRTRLRALGRPEAILCGTESHVCVQQTALGLVEQGLACRLVADASGSRDPANHTAACARMARAGIDIVSTEMVLFEWLGRADTDAFRDLLPLIK